MNTEKPILTGSDKRWADAEEQSAPLTKNEMYVEMDAENQRLKQKISELQSREASLLREIEDLKHGMMVAAKIHAEYKTEYNETISALRQQNGKLIAVVNETGCKLMNVIGSLGGN